MTKKDLWFVLNEGEEGKVGHGAGVLREELSEREDERGLLGHSRDYSLAESIEDRDEG
jgi:chloride channel 3/4/5